MNAILKEDPPELSRSSRVIPPGLERIVSHCLEKRRRNASSPRAISRSTSDRSR